MGRRTVRRDGVQIPQNFVRNLCTDSLSAKQPTRLLCGELSLGGAQERQGVLPSQVPTPPQMLRKKGVRGHNPCASAPGPTPVDRHPRGPLDCVPWKRHWDFGRAQVRASCENPTEAG